ncbi:hypothetical protein BU15DRAFT_69695 [Melanogaster broomeanus]|nr:hypothetical protein BU15DRAFT_69695 [Melanogaster broomeanus]
MVDPKPSPSLSHESYFFTVELKRLVTKHLFPVLRHPKGLTGAELSRLEAVNLARSDFRNYFEFNRDWDFFRLDTELRTLFPRLFAYLDGRPKLLNRSYDSSQDSRYKYLPPYLLCIRSHKEIAVASGVDFPTGEVIFEKVKAGKRPSRDESDIIFVTRDNIPLKVVEQWTQSASKGKRRAVRSSSMSDSDVASSFTSSRLAGSDSELDAPQQPPIMRLKRRCVATPPGIASEISATTGVPATIASGWGQDMIDLTTTNDDHCDTDHDSDIHMASVSGAPTVTATPPAPTLSLAQPPVSGSFTVDESLTNPWKSDRTFTF